MYKTPIVTLEDFEEHYRQRRVRHADLTGEPSLVDVEFGISTQRGALKRFVPIRPPFEITRRTLGSRLRAAWGVLTGRYDALHWKLADEEVGQ